MTDEAKRPGRGGARPGAGRKAKNAGPIPDADLRAALAAPPPDDIEEVAGQHAAMALGALVKILIHGENETAAVGAANTVLDRGYGRPAVDVGGSQLPLFDAGASFRAVAGEIRTEARKYAHLAIERLRRIADSGRSEAARRQAAKSLLDRGLGTVPVARVDPDASLRPLGKKEQAVAAATAPPSAESDWGNLLKPRVH
jgi:hypothetical protein